jgi:DNA-binding transcriptional regulator LsrR (DeoR family)
VTSAFTKANLRAAMNAHADAHIRRLGQSGRVLSLTSGASYHALVDLFSFRNSRLLRVRIALGRTGRDAQSRDEQAEQHAAAVVITKISIQMLRVLMYKYPSD